jgi:hypothetical protein
MEKITRKELYELVWQEPMLALSKKYQISDTGLRKICKRLNIPVPQMGYWQKVKHGKKVARPKLPELPEDKGEVLLDIRSDILVYDPWGKGALNDLEKRILEDKHLQLSVPGRLTNADDLIVQAKKSLESHKPGHFDGGLVRASFGELDIIVNYKSTSRALRIFDTIIKGLRTRGHEVIVRYQDTFAIVAGEEIKLKLRERLRREKVKNPNYSWEDTVYHATGLLYLKVDRWSSEYEFKDGSTQLEEQMPRIIAKLELTGAKLKHERQEREKYRAEQKEKERIQLEIIKKKEKDQNDFKELLQQALQWHQATILRNYIEALKENLTRDGVLTMEQNNWFRWAQDKTDSFDPLLKTNTRSA